MTLVFDERDRLAKKNRPGLHVLIVGVGVYPHLQGKGLEDVPRAYETTTAIADWLVKRKNNLQAPLATIRMLQTPTTEMEDGFKYKCAAATLDNFLMAAHDWRVDASAHKDGVALFYFVGHSLQLSATEQILMLEGFGDPVGGPLRHTVSVDNLYHGMTTTSNPHMARVQYFFVDASRKSAYEIFPKLREANPTDVFDYNLGPDYRIAPIFQATVPGEWVWWRPGGLSWFAIALLEALEGAAAEPSEEYVEGKIRWRVSISSLTKYLERAFKRHNSLLRKYALETSYELGGVVKDTTIVYFDGPPPSRSLVLDRRAKLRGKPGMHLLICGVSSYPYVVGAGNINKFGIKPLISTAISAYRVYKWLLDHEAQFPLPLATCRLLLSPSPVELESEEALVDLGERCTLQKFLSAVTEWQADAATNEDSMSLFYFAGHGVQERSGDTILLLEDFGDGVGGALKNAVAVDDIFDGMAPSSAAKKMARRQIYLIDACRATPRDFRRYASLPTSPVFNVELMQEDARSAPIYYAAVPGGEAQALRADQSLFSKALIECLSTTACETNGDGSKIVTIFSLQRALREALVKYNELYMSETSRIDFVVGGQEREDFVVLQNCDQPTQVVAADGAKASQVMFKLGGG